MLDEIKLLLGESADNYSDALIQLILRQSIAEVEDYCNREADAVMEYAAMRITVIKLNRIHSEGASSQSFSGVSENYIDGWPADIIASLNKKRKIRVF
jgi:hypothetical protein